MLKKFVYTLAAAAMAFGFAACSSDEPLAGAAGQDGLVTFTAQLPAELASRAFGEGENAKKLTVYVYEKDVKTLIETKTAEFPADGLTTTVELQLVNGKSYDILFWADAYGENGADTPFSYTASTQTVKVDYTKMASNEDKGDAFFFAEKGLEVKGAINKTIYLTRPFAQINFGTDDLDAAAVVNAFGITADNKFGTVMSKLALTAAMPDQLNLFDGTVTTTDGAAATAFAAVAPTEEDTFPYGTGYDYMSMSYVLVGADRDVVDLKYTVLNGDAEYNTLEIAAVPVQRNYRTNIYGSLLTSKVNFTVEIDNEFMGGEAINPNATKVTVNSAQELADAVNNATSDIVVTFGADIEGDATVNQKEGVNVIIDGADHQYKNGRIQIDGYGRNNGAEMMTIKNINFVVENGTNKEFINVPAKVVNQHYSYAHNITVTDCNFSSESLNANVTGVRFVQSYHIRLQNCKAINLHSLCQLQSIGSDVVINNVEVECKSGIALGNAKNVKVSNAKITLLSDTGYGIRADGDANYGELTVNNCDFTGVKRYAVVVRKMTNASYNPYKITLSGENKFNEASPLNVVFTNGDDDADPEALTAPVRPFTLTGADGLKVFPAE